MLMVRPLIRREAVASSAMEGTYSTVSNVLQAESSKGTQDLDTRDVVNYVAAAETGTTRLGTLPIARRLLTELHGILMRDAGGRSQTAGKFRSGQVFVGSRGRPVDHATLVPAPPDHLDDLVSGWERWIHNDDVLPMLRVALGHWYFEVIHPFDDGNGRIGRLVVVLQLIDMGLLRGNLLTISPWLEERRDEYIARLRGVTEDGAVDEWVEFFCRGLDESSRQSHALLRGLIDVRDEAVAALRAAGRRGTSIRIAEGLIGFPVFTVAEVSERLDVRFATANLAVGQLEELGLLREITGGSYNRIYASPTMIDLLQ